MNPVDAIRLMAKSYPGGVEALAILCGKAPETLRHEIGGKDARYKLGVLDACTISEACISAGSLHCHAYANAVASNCGGFVALPVRGETSGDLHRATAGLVKSCAEVSVAVAEALRDGTVSENERRVIEKHLTDVLAQVQSVEGDVRAGARPLRAA
jgi:hypothetical protein